MHTALSCVTQPVSWRSDVALHNKKHPNLIFYLSCLWFWIAIKRKLPVSNDQFQFRLIVHHPRVSLNQSQDDMVMHYKIKALHKLIYDQFCHYFIALKRKLPVSTEQFQFRLKVHWHCLRVSLNQFQDDMMLHYIIKALKIS